MEYFEKFYREVFFPYLDETGIKTVFHLGDFFDRRKYINFNILHRTRKCFVDECVRRNLDVHLILGNHDVFYRNRNSINSPTEILRLLPNWQIYEKPTEKVFYNQRVLMVPWINNRKLESAQDKIQNSKAKILFGHLEIQGFRMHRNQKKNDTGQEKKLFSGYDLVLSGHFHHKSSKKNIHYLGAPYEMTFSDMNDIRGFHVLDFKDLDLTYVKNPNKIFHLIRYNDHGKELKHVLKKGQFDQYEKTYVKILVEKKTNPYYFDQFVDALYAVEPADVSIVEDLYTEVVNEAEEMELQEDTLSILNNYVDTLEMDSNRDKVKGILKELYNEASQMEEV